MNKFFILGFLLGLILFSMSVNNASAVCCFPWDITHHIDPETGTLVINGVLWNDSYKGEPFGNTNYRFEFKNEDGELLFEKDILITHKLPIQESFVIPPGVSFPFQVTINDIDKDILKQVAYVSTGGTNTINYYKWKPADLKTELHDIKKISTLYGETINDIFYKWQISGTITNTHSERTENVYVLASLHEEEHHNVVGVAGYSEYDVQPLMLDGHETKEFVIYAVLPNDKIPDEVNLYAESDDSSMIYERTKPIILKPAEHIIKHRDLDTPITISANVTSISRDAVDFDWIIQIKKSPKSLAEGDITKYPESKVEFIKIISDSISAQESKIIQYSWIPESGGIYFYEMYLWNEDKPVSFPFRGTFISSDQILVYSNSLKEQLKSGTLFNEIKCQGALVLILKHDGSPACVKQETKQKLIERGWTIDHTIIASIENKKVNLQDPTIPRTSDGLIDYHELIQIVSKPLFVDLFAKKGITVHQDDIELMRGPWILMYTDYSSACGYTIVDDTVYWLQSDIKQDTLTKASIMTENPDPCRPSNDSCFCMAEYQMTENTVTELTFFDKSQESYVGKTFQDYLNQGGKIVNMPKNFVVGDHNFEMKLDEITFCGTFVSDKIMNFGPDRVIRDGVVAFRYFSGVIKNDDVISFSLEDPMRLCAINPDAKVYDFK